jgi:hypothetical protein
MIDSVVNLGGKSRAAHTQWDGRVYAIPTSHILTMTAEGKITEIGQAFPWLSNCTVPRAVFTRLLERFGSICDSTTPDSCFAYRFCATHDRLLHFDRAIGILYGYHRSIGIGYLRGSGGDFDQFMRQWGERPWLDAAPIPGLTLGQNILFHEYELVRRASGMTLPPIQMPGYLRELARALSWVDDPNRAAEIRAVLRQHGWTESPAADTPRATRVRDGLPWLKTFVRDLRQHTTARQLWSVDFVPNQRGVRGAVVRGLLALDALYHRASARVRRLRGRYRAIAVGTWSISELEFATDQEAVRCLLAAPAPPSTTNALDWMAQVGVDVTPPSLRPGHTA